jgi:hypothetical protein
MNTEVAFVTGILYFFLYILTFYFIFTSLHILIPLPVNFTHYIPLCITKPVEQNACKVTYLLALPTPNPFTGLGLYTLDYLHSTLRIHSCQQIAYSSRVSTPFEIQFGGGNHDEHPSTRQYPLPLHCTQCWQDIWH